MTDDTRKPVSALSGRELDAAVAEEVMGYETGVDGGHLVCLDENGDVEIAHGPMMHGRVKVVVPHYSTDIAAAWEVWQELPEPRRLHQYIDGRGVVDAGVMVVCGGGAYGASGQHIHSGDGSYVKANADTAPEAICRAALKAARSED